MPSTTLPDGKGGGQFQGPGRVQINAAGTLTDCAEPYNVYPSLTAALYGSLGITPEDEYLFAGWSSWIVANTAEPLEITRCRYLVDTWTEDPDRLSSLHEFLSNKKRGYECYQSLGLSGIDNQAESVQHVREWHGLVA